MTIPFSCAVKDSHLNRDVLPETFYQPGFLESALFLSDLDGTLLNSKSVLSEDSLNELNSLLCTGGLNFSFATARDYNSAKKVTRGLNLKLPFIIANGVFIFKPDEDLPIYTNFIKTAADFNSYFDPKSTSATNKCINQTDLFEVLQRLVNHFKASPLVLSYIDQNDVLSYINNSVLPLPSREFINTHQTGNLALRPLPASKIKALTDGNVYCINMIDSFSKLEPIYHYLKNLNKFYLVFEQELYREEWWLSVYANGVNKGLAAKHLQESLGLKHLVVFGDAINDLPLFQVADFKFAMGNAIDDLKSIATSTLLTNDQSGVANFLNLLIRELPNSKCNMV